MSTSRWEGAVAVVTGASRGIGRAVAEAAAARGARVGLIARTEPDLLAASRAIPGSVSAVADIGDRHQVDDAVRSIEAELGPVDILVANAGIGLYGPLAEADVAEVERLVQVNVLGTFYPLRTVLPGMIERRRGHIVVVSSIAGRIGSPFEAAYAATKFAQVGMAEALAVEVSGQGIGVSIVNPGVVDTSFFEARGHPFERDFPKKIPATDVADAVVRAVEGRRAETFVPSWFGPAVLVRHLAPQLYRWGTRRSFRSELSGR